LATIAGYLKRPAHPGESAKAKPNSQFQLAFTCSADGFQPQYGHRRALKRPAHYRKLAKVLMSSLFYWLSFAQPCFQPLAFTRNIMQPARTSNSAIA
jgi:hypothetical protein